MLGPCIQLTLSLHLLPLRHRYNNTKQFELQVRSKPNLLQKGKLKHTVATSRPPGATAVPPRRAGGSTTAGGTAGGGSSRAAAALAAATSKGHRAAAAAAAAKQPRPKQQVPDTPDSRGKALRSAAEAEARLARARFQPQQEQQDEVRPEQSLLSGGVIISPDKSQQLLRGPGAAVPAGLDAIPATDTRPPLAAVPAGVAQAAVAAVAGGARLMRSPSMRLDFGEPSAAHKLGL